MHKVCILTDNSVQYQNPCFLGNELVITIPFSTQLEASKDEKYNWAGSVDHYGIDHPQVKEILKLLIQLHQEHTEILVITLSSALSGLYSVVEKAIGQFGELGKIKLVDSHTTSIGMGILVQIAAGLAAQGVASHQIEHQLRVTIPNIYTLLCLPNLSYLAAGNYITSAQAVVGEMLGVLPLFSLENGCLTSIQKVRTQRHVFEIFQEFVDEFNDPFYVAIIKNSDNSKMFKFRDYLSTNFPQTSFGEYQLSEPLVDLLGPQSISLIVVENKNWDNNDSSPEIRG